MKRTRLGKEVGSIKTDVDGFTYWAENDWTTGAPGFMLIAPSGARIKWFADEASVKVEVAGRNAEWFATT